MVDKLHCVDGIHHCKAPKCLLTSGRSCCSYEEVHFFHQYHTNILLKIAVFQLSQLVRQIWSTDDTTPRHLHRWHLGMTGLSSLGTDRCRSTRHRDREISRIFPFQTVKNWLGWSQQCINFSTVHLQALPDPLDAMPCGVRNLNLKILENQVSKKMMTINENPCSLYHVYFCLYPTYLQPLQSLVSDAPKKWCRQHSLAALRWLEAT